MRTMPAGTRYHTISHVWDKVSLLPDPYKQTGVLLTSHEKQAAVARIAEAAGVPVWMDVYSIDQENEEFKNAQVSIMYNVYNNAEKCHVLLTPTDAEMFKRVIQVLRGLASPQFPDLLCNMDDDPLMNLHHPFSFAYAAVEFGVLYNRRVWTLQEVHASKGVTYYDAEGVEVVDGEKVLEIVGRVVAGAMLFRMRVDAGHPVVQGLVYSSRVSGGRLKGRADGVLRFAWNVLRAYVSGRREEVVGKLEGCGFREALGGFANTFFDLIAANFEPMVRLSVGFRVASVKHDYVYGIAGMVGLDVPVDYGMDVGELVLIARRGLFVKGLLRIEVAAAEPTCYLMANVDVEQNPWWNPKWTKVQRLWTREFPAPVLVDRTHGVDKSHTVSVKAVSAPVTISEDDVNFMAPDILDQEMHSLGGGSQNQNFIVASGLMSQVMHKSTIRDLKCLSYIRNEVLQSLCDPANESILNSVYLVVGTLTLVSGLSEQVVFVYPETTRKYFEKQCRLHLVAFLDQVILCAETEKAEGLSVRPLCYIFPVIIGSSPLDLLAGIEPVDVTIL
ncbi:hypothetical protein HDU79_008414 [Rhizoclosmatium sp. JEL0117]|nr:hypothetical protein HDU79_008414 [Rhizoclosmatium sp. JEL0117]